MTSFCLLSVPPKLKGCDVRVLGLLQLYIFELLIILMAMVITVIGVIKNSFTVQSREIIMYIILNKCNIQYIIQYDL